jgi:hypothetical protein
MNLGKLEGVKLPRIFGTTEVEFRIRLCIQVYQKFGTVRIPR